MLKNDQDLAKGKGKKVSEFLNSAGAAYFSVSAAGACPRGT